jgi:hypothetical protein
MSHPGSIQYTVLYHNTHTAGNAFVGSNRCTRRPLSLSGSTVLYAVRVGKMAPAKS